MKTKDAIRFFKGRASLAKALGLTPPAVYQWKEYPPPKRQLQLQQITGGKLMAEPGCADNLLGVSPEALLATPAPTPAPDNGKRRRWTDKKGGK